MSRIQILDESVCVSLCVNVLGESPISISSIVDRLSSLIIIGQIFGEGKRIQDLTNAVWRMWFIAVLFFCYQPIQKVGLVLCNPLLL